MKRVLVAAPIGPGKEYSINEWLQWIATQSYDDVRVCLCVNGPNEQEVDAKISFMREVEINGDGLYLLKDENYKGTIQSKLHSSREKIRKFALNMDFDYIFWLDTDTIPTFKTTLQKLIGWGTPVVSGVYCYKKSKQPVAMDKETGTNFTLDKLRAASDKKELVETWGVGLGCVLMSKDAYSSVAFDYRKFEERVSEDFMLCEELKAKGYKIMLDPWIICRHYSQSDFEMQ